ncbi:general transcription factor 3C polypeptide 6 isoform X2 [Macrosteles quadrilineatus]|nr:general transcription factor 3C polypeptide 6 isoform X2 [Macrosteles quadrilineatus]
MAATDANVSEEIEEEEILVYADFDAVIDESMIQKDSLIKVIGLDGDEPFLQMGTQMFSGKWHDTVGTNLFFEAEPAPPPADPVFSDTPQTLLNYKYKTSKCLELSRVFINSKTKENESLSLLDGDGITENSVALGDNPKEPQPMEAMEIEEGQAPLKQAASNVIVNDNSHTS